MRLASIASLLALAGAGLFFARPVAAAEPAEHGCVFNREIHPEGDEICQSDVRKRCENGAWVDVGTCHDGGAPLEQPKAGGGDAVPPPLPPPKPVPPRTGPPR